MTYNLFISHSWAYGDAYDKLIGLLDAAPNFQYVNYSIPKDDPIHSQNDYQLAEAIRARLGTSHVAVTLAGVYATYSRWINIEVRLAQSAWGPHRVPILAIEPWASERTSQVVKDAADKIVGWNTNSIVTGIRELAR